MEQQELFFMSGAMENGATTLGCSLGVLTKPSISLLYNPAIIILGIHCVLEAYVHTIPEHLCLWQFYSWLPKLGQCHKIYE